jgi:hypothetical protein
MKTAILILIALLTSGCVSSSPKLSFSEVGGDGAVYTITGKKDPRLEARYLATYVSQNLQNEGCYSYVSQKGFARPKITGTSISVKDGDYTIKLPVILKDKNRCDYRFNGLELIMKRPYDEELSSIHPILSKKQEVNPIYWKTKGGGL